MKLIIPERINEELNIILQKEPPYWNWKIDWFNYIIELVNSPMHSQKWTYINMASLRKKYKQLPFYLNYLAFHGLIVVKSSYKPGRFSKGYMISPELNKGYIIMKSNEKIEILKAGIYTSQYSKIFSFPTYLKKMYRHLKSVELDIEKAIKFISIKETDNIAAKVARVMSFENKERYFKRNTTNDRLDTNLTGLRSDLKQFIKGEKLVQIDLVNSQPYFLFQLIKAIMSHSDPVWCKEKLNYNNIFEPTNLQEIKELQHTELSKFEKDVISGDLYALYIDSKTDRNSSKLNFFKVLYSDNKIEYNGRWIKPYIRLKEIFNKKYGSVGYSVELLKNGDYKKLAIYLQRLESHVFIDVICKKLVKNKIIPLTIHDAIIVPASKQEDTEKIINDVFISYFDRSPIFKITNIN